MIAMMDHLDERFSLDLVLLPTVLHYLDRLKSLAARRPRLRVLPPLLHDVLPSRLNEYDIGVYLLPPNSLNNRFALPNKFFEFIQGRLAIAIGPSPEMAKLVRQYDCGMVSEDFTPQSLADCLRGLTRERIDYFKERSHAAANELCFERNAATMLKVINDLIGHI